MKIETFTLLGISMFTPEIPVTVVFSQSICIFLKHSQHVSIWTVSFRIGLDIHMSVGKYPVVVKCAHAVFPFVRLVTSTNKSVLQVVLRAGDLGKNGKQ